MNYWREAKVEDLKSFLNRGGVNSIKYRPERGQKHRIYIPFKNVTTKNNKGEEITKKQIIAITAGVHDLRMMDGKYKAVICLKGIKRKGKDGTILNDGTCGFCERVPDAWEIYKYRLESEKERLRASGMQEKEIEKHIEKVKRRFVDERKVKEARKYIYLLVIVYKTHENGEVIKGEDGLPEYELKVMKLSEKRAEKFQKQAEDSGDTLEGCELTISYPDENDLRLVVSQSTTAVVFPNSRIVNKFPGLAKKITHDIKNFTWEGIEDAFPEWKGMTTTESKKVLREIFTFWDEYKELSKKDPRVKYTEYTTVPTKNTPDFEIDEDLKEEDIFPHAQNDEFEGLAENIEKLPDIEGKDPILF